MQEKKITSFMDLNTWKEAHTLVLMIYRVTRLFPKTELFGLISQMRRAAVSVTSNIAEGFCRESYRGKIQFYAISRGSLTELQDQIIIARDVDYLVQHQYDQLMNHSILCHRLLNGLIKKTKYFSQHPKF